ncbi:rhomboid-like protein [Streptomyces sp. NPDC048506]|uniref:rhomboid-like protein n=1 Tax=Streptomyces sp. NPDC048506 TaxID=3155028 RepID=UPI00341F515E
MEPPRDGRPWRSGGNPLGWVRNWVRSTPGTHIWLLIIGVTSLVIASASEGLEQFLVHRTSSNIHELNEHPLPSLLISGFWIERPGSFLLYVVMFELVHANVERWIGTWRWLLTVGGAHVAATLASQELVLLAIEGHQLPRSMTHVVDIGVSYGLAAAAGLLTYRLRPPWCYVYLVGLLVFFGIPLTTGATFTDFGHAIALTMGFAAWPLTPAAALSAADDREGAKDAGAEQARPPDRAADQGPDHAVDQGPDRGPEQEPDRGADGGQLP